MPSNENIHYLTESQGDSSRFMTRKTFNRIADAVQGLASRSGEAYKFGRSYLAEAEPFLDDDELPGIAPGLEDETVIGQITHYGGSDGSDADVTAIWFNEQGRTLSRLAAREEVGRILGRVDMSGRSDGSYVDATIEPVEFGSGSHEVRISSHCRLVDPDHAFDVFGHAQRVGMGSIVNDTRDLGTDDEQAYLGVADERLGNSIAYSLGQIARRR